MFQDKSNPAPAWRDHKWHLQHGTITGECLGHFLGSCAGFWPNRELLAYEGRRYTYRDIHRWSLVTAQFLSDHGVTPGDRILIQAVNSADLLMIQFAAWRIGAITVPIVPMYRGHELRAIIRDTNPTAIVASGHVGSRCYHQEIDELLSDMDIAVSLKIILGEADSAGEWASPPNAPDAHVKIDETILPEPADASECTVILYTSGSTSAPKGALLRGGAIINSARSFQKSVGIGPEDVALCGTPLGHTGALINGFIVPMTIGARSVVVPAWKPDLAISAIASEKVTYMSAPPLILQDIVERYEAQINSDWRLKKFYSGGGVVAPSLIERAQKVGLSALRAYGMTETTCNFTICHSNAPIERRAQYDGHPYFGSEIGIVDENRQPKPLGTIGEVRVRGPFMMIGYTDPEITRAQMDEDGWFYTGDLGSLDAENWLTIQGRIKDIINRGGEKFSSKDIEDAIASHPDIADVAVVGAPDDRFGEVVAAFIRLTPQAAWTGDAHLFDHLERAQLAKQKRPVQWHIVSEFPRTPSGKVQKQILRDRLWNAN